MWTASACHKVSLIPILLHCLSQNTLIMGLVCHRGVYGMIWWKSKPMLQIVLNSSILPPVNMGATAWGSLTKAFTGCCQGRAAEMSCFRDVRLKPWCPDAISSVPVLIREPSETLAQTARLWQEAEGESWSRCGSAAPGLMVVGCNPGLPGHTWPTRPP